MKIPLEGGCFFAFDSDLTIFVTIRRVWAFHHQEFVVEPTQPEKIPLKKSASNNVWAMASEGMQLAVTLLILIFIGFKLDKRFGTSPWFLLGGALIGIVAGLYNFLRKYISKS